MIVPAVAVVGGSGGAGGSLVAAGLVFVTVRERSPVMLVDLDTAGSHAAMLGTSGVRGADDLLAVGDDLNAAHVRAAAYPHPSGAAVIAAPDPSRATELPRLVARILALPDRPPLVIDLGSGPTALARCAPRGGTLVVVVPHDVAGVHACALTLERAQRDADRVVVVGNPGSRREDMSGRAVARAIGADLQIGLPRSDREALSLATGECPDGRRRRLVTGLRELAVAVGLLPAATDGVP